MVRPFDGLTQTAEHECWVICHNRRGCWGVGVRVGAVFRRGVAA